MGKRTRTASTAAALVGGALLLAGCGGQAATNSAAAPEGLGGDTASSDTAPATRADDHAGGTHDDISASNCSAEDFEITMQAQPDGGVFLLQMKNTSDESCELGGWVDVTPTNMAGQPIDTPTENVNLPGPDANLTLEPGKSAFSGVKIELAEQSDPDAQVASGFTATPSDMQGEAAVEVSGLNGGGSPMEIAIKSMQIGTLQPSPQGVVAF
ncbi:DUF4232 domain-containing protein [Saccharopolyspora sp. NFXS83]|uniref:DUF4232 domain-containing protein n=1 Tax=Saccharopolyspora sp. NFXS83 TaxID=2993560 RepID=UPI00224AAF7F|nr:DUF4232 domain-containing protein [Saccharopolyspora sp. NFXS83]MCX2728706.1 DUF4232 domain-containing protein [Saccharopolyspora sp. NFXS83]